MIQHVPYQLIPLCACLYTQWSLCERSIIFERCGGECVVGGVCFADAHSRKS